jgi:hypothetical protein
MKPNEIRWPVADCHKQKSEAIDDDTEVKCPTPGKMSNQSIGCQMRCIISDAANGILVATIPITDPNVDPGIDTRLRHPNTTPRCFLGTISVAAANERNCSPAPTPCHLSAQYREELVDKQSHTIKTDPPIMVFTDDALVKPSQHQQLIFNGSYAPAGDGTASKFVSS